MGQLDVQLNDQGHQQAKLVRQRLATEHIKVIYLSDLQRASETAKNIAAHHPHVQVVYDLLLRERHVGVLQGQPILPDDFIGNTKKSIDRTVRPEDGESIHDVKARATKWFEIVKRQYPDDTLVVVGHGLYLYVLLEVAVQDGANAERQDFLLENASVTVLDVHATGRAEVIHLNDISHLGP